MQIIIYSYSEPQSVNVKSYYCIILYCLLLFNDSEDTWYHIPLLLSMEPWSGHKLLVEDPCHQSCYSQCFILAIDQLNVCMWIGYTFHHNTILQLETSGLTLKEWLHRGDQTRGGVNIRLWSKQMLMSLHLQLLAYTFAA